MVARKNELRSPLGSHGANQERHRKCSRCGLNIRTDNPAAHEAGKACEQNRGKK